MCFMRMGSVNIGTSLWVERGIVGDQLSPDRVKAEREVPHKPMKLEYAYFQSLCKPFTPIRK